MLSHNSLEKTTKSCTLSTRLKVMSACGLSAHENIVFPFHNSEVNMISLIYGTYLGVS